MEFATRDRYRHVVERLARASSLSEVAVADAALKLARESATRETDGPAAHVGFYLIDKGLPDLERIAEARMTPWENVCRAGREHPCLARSQ